MTILSILQSVIAILLIIFIMLQQRGTALGSSFGGGDSGGGGFYSTRRGIQKKLLWATIVLGTIFLALAVLRLII
ncbi:preprotein translocase subunit SecG [Patescibacteria group bacterium]|nr:preprotein translocase subunit SecG [Patescibacteria group bacterium]